jgi:hypothetical protein
MGPGRRLRGAPAVLTAPETDSCFDPCAERGF